LGKNSIEIDIWLQEIQVKSISGGKKFAVCQMTQIPSQGKSISYGNQFKCNTFLVARNSFEINFWWQEIHLKTISCGKKYVYCPEILVLPPEAN